MPEDLCVALCVKHPLMLLVENGNESYTIHALVCFASFVVVVISELDPPSQPMGTCRSCPPAQRSSVRVSMVLHHEPSLSQQTGVNKQYALKTCAVFCV